MTATKIMKLWIDDYRDAPDESWTEVRNVERAIKALIHFDFDEISIDHDIENRPDDETFKPVAYFIGERYMSQSFRMRIKAWNPKITIHSDNPVGAKEIHDIFKDYGLKSKIIHFTSEKDFKAKYGLE